MKKYFVVLEQKGEGCDYTIGCGITYKKIKAKNEYDLYKHIDEWYGDDIEIIYYTEVENMKILDIDILKKEIEKEKEEYEMYLILKEKYEEDGEMNYERC